MMVEARACSWKDEPEIRPFVVMRLAHEAIRVALDDLEEASQSGEGDHGAAIWGDLMRLVDLHMRQEEEYFFPLLNKDFDGCVEDEHLGDEHVDDVKERKAITKLFAKISEEDDDDVLEDLREKIKEFSAGHRKHLEHEEDVMMPKTMKLGDFAKRAWHVNQLIFIDHEEFQTFMFPFVIGKLVAARPPPMVANYLKGVRAASLTHQWEELRGVARDALSEKVLNNASHPVHAVLAPLGTPAPEPQSAAAVAASPDGANGNAGAEKGDEDGDLASRLADLGLNVDVLRALSRELEKPAAESGKPASATKKSSSSRKVAKKDSKKDTKKETKKTKKEKKPRK